LGLFIEILQIVQFVFTEIEEEQLLERIFQNELAYEYLTRLFGEPKTGMLQPN